MFHPRAFAPFLALPLPLAVSSAAQDGVPIPPNAAAASVSGVSTQAASSAGRIAVVYTDIVGSPTSAVPGFPGASFSSFDRPFGSPNGNWIISTDTDLPTTEDETVVANGVVVAREGTPVLGTGTELTGFIDQKFAIDDAGNFVYATNTDAATTADEVLVSVIGGVPAIVAREGDAIPVLPGTTYGLSIDGGVLTSTGTIGFAASSILGATTTTNEVLVLGNTLLMQRGVTVPPGQAGGGTEFIDNIDFEGFWTNLDGSRWLAQGDLTGSTATDDVLIVDGAVVLQEGSVIPGSSFLEPIDLNGIVEGIMDPAGNWYARGDNATTQQDWVVRNGQVIAAVGSPIFAGATELWSDAVFTSCFFMQLGNGVGDYIIGGVTNNAVTNDGVLVLNNERVILREGDPIDLDGNGFYDDGLFVNTIGNDDGFLADDLTFYVVVTMRDGAGAAAGDAFLRLDLADAVGTTFCDAQPNSTTRPAYIAGEGSAVVALNDLTLSVCELPVGSNGYFVVSRDQNVIVNPGANQGILCVASTAMGRYGNNVLTADPAGTVSLAVDLTAIPQPLGSVPALAGDTWNWQYWYRDANPGPTSNFSTALSVTFR